MSRDWTKSFFRDEIFNPGASEAVAAASAEVRFLWKELGLKKGSRVLDVACGTGRHATALARRGARVQGLDVTSTYLREARRAARGLGNVNFMLGDMRRIPFRAEFDAAINIWTSFGYFEKPSDDLKVLRGIARALKPGGLFLIDLLDFATVRRYGHTRHWFQRDDRAYVLQEAVCVGGWDPKTINEWTVLSFGKRPRKIRFPVRGYDRPRLFAALRKAGLRPIKTWKSLSAGANAINSSDARLVVLSRRV